MLAVRGGTVVDGTGGAAFRADVIVDGDRIADVIPEGGIDGASPEGMEEIDATGLLVTPGFVDFHSHSDTYLLIEPDAPSKLSQGVTTEVNGQCGGSAVPRYAEARLSSDWASMDYPALAGDGSLSVSHGPSWRSLAEYRALFDAVKPAINTVQFTGHNTLRSSVIGYAPMRATPDSLKAMERLLAEELDSGSWGLTTGLIYQPGKYSDEAEVTALARVAAGKGGFYATHMRSEGDRIFEAIDEVLSLVRATGIRAEISHLKTSGRANWGKMDEVLEKIGGAVERGELLGSDRYPYCAAGTDLDVVLPDWAGEGGLKAELLRLREPAARARIVAELDASPRDWSGVMVGGTWHSRTAAMSGGRVDALARDLGVTPGELVVEILDLDEGRTGAFFFGMCEENLHKALSMPWILPGSDASLRAPWGPLGKDHPHPRAYGTMPRFFRLLTGRVDGHARICSREEAVRRMTSSAAERFGIKGRGVIAKGAYADIAVWSEDGFRDTAEYLRPHSFASGMEAVIVNGRVAYRGGKFLHAGSGRFLER